jgi:hypothetical protein
MEVDILDCWYVDWEVMDVIGMVGGTHIPAAEVRAGKDCSSSCLGGSVRVVSLYVRGMYVLLMS